MKDEERDAFEKVYAVQMGETLGRTVGHNEIKALRQGDHYGVDRGYLNGAWYGWQAAKGLL